MTILEELKAKVAKCAAENVVSASLRCTKAGLEGTTVHDWVTTYQKRLDSLRKEGKSLTVSVLSEKSRGRSLLIGSELEEQVKSFVGQLNSSGAVVNSAIVRAAARGIILAKEANLLEENGGGISLTKESRPKQKGTLCYVSPCCKAMFLPPLLSISLDIRDIRARRLQNRMMPPFYLTSLLIQVIGYINNGKFSSASNLRKFCFAKISKYTVYVPNNGHFLTVRK